MPLLTTIYYIILLFDIGDTLFRGSDPSLIFVKNSRFGIYHMAKNEIKNCLYDIIDIIDLYEKCIYQILCIK